MPSVFITGANRGLGLEWARQYTVAGWRVHASCSYPEAAHGLRALAAGHASLTLHRPDVTDVHQQRRPSGVLRTTRLVSDQTVAPDTAGYPIASGVIEGAWRCVVNDRMERSGMRWVLEGAHATLGLRRISLSSL